MSNDIVLFWVVCLVALTGLMMSIRRIRSGGRGWALLLTLILVLNLAGGLSRRGALVYAALATWLLLVLVPALLAKLSQRRLLQQHYGTAYRLARIISWLHPADGLREQPRILNAIRLAEAGQFDPAAEILKRYKTSKSQTDLWVVASLFRVTGQWEDMLAWEAQRTQALERAPELMPYLLRARGETGDVAGLVDLYSRRQKQIANLHSPILRDLCRLMLFSFTGKRKSVEHLLNASSLRLMPTPTQNFWLATTELFAGERALAKEQFEALLPHADPVTRRAIERRLVQILDRQMTLDAAREQTIERAALEQSHEERFGAKPTLFSNRTRVTQTLIALNLIMFLVEVLFRASEDPYGLYQLGALFPPAVRAGEWWRLVTSLFLHFGPLHLVFNMIGLWFLGPFVEFAIGSRKFTLVYLLTGIVSMLFVMAFASGPAGERLTVGASGSIMGLVGATGALMVPGWLKEKAVAARKRLLSMIAFVTIQTAMDAVIPEVSMTAHLTGAAVGFVVTMLLRNPHRVQDKCSDPHRQCDNSSRFTRMFL